MLKWPRIEKTGGNYYPHFTDEGTKSENINEQFTQTRTDSTLSLEPRSRVLIHKTGITVHAPLTTGRRIKDPHKTQSLSICTNKIENVNSAQHSKVDS